LPEKDRPSEKIRLAVERFRKYRRLCKVFFGAGIVASLVHLFIRGDEIHLPTGSVGELILGGLGLLGLGLIVIGGISYFLFCQKCPACKKTFRGSSDHDEGLPVFNRIERCPFCGINLEGPLG
jgi:hypothetical protein